MQQGDRVVIRDDAFGDALRLVKHRGQAGKVIKHWPNWQNSDGIHAGLVCIRLDDGESLYVFGNEVAPLQVTVGGQGV